MTSPHDDVPPPPTWASPSGAPAPAPGHDAGQPAPVPAGQGAPGWGQPSAPPAPTGWGQPPAPPAPPAWDRPVPPPGPPAPGAGWGPAAPPPGTPYGQPWRPPALQPGIVPLRPLGFGELLDGAFRAIRANPRVMFGVAAIVVTVAVALQSLVKWYLQGFVATWTADALTGIDPTGELGAADQLAGSISDYLTLPIVQAATTVLTGLVIVSVSRSVLGRTVTTGEVLRSWRVWWVLGFTVLEGVAAVLVLGAWVGAVVALAVSGQTGVAVLLGLAGGLGVIVLLLWYEGRTLLVPAALMLEGKGFWRTIARAWRLTRGSFWRLLGTYILVSIIVGFVSGIVMVPATMITSLLLNDPSGTTFWGIVITGVADIIGLTLSTTYLASVVALLYIDVRMRREGLDIELARAAQAA